MNEKQASVAARIAELACLPMSELWTVWDRYFPRRPDYPNRMHVESRIAYKLQEEAFGGLAPEIKQRLEAIGAKHSKIKLLRNRIYLGELSHKGNWYPGAHPPIIDQELWDKVHAVLARDGHARSVETKIRSRTDALLRGLLYAPSGERMYPTYSRKNGRKYHYYVSKSESRFGAPGKSYERLPAPEIEAAVVAQIRTVLTSPESIASVVRHIQRNGAQIDEATTVMAMGRLNDVWDQLFPVERHRIANLMIERVDLVHAGAVQGIKVKWREIGWNALIEEFAPQSIGAELLEVESA